MVSRIGGIEAIMEPMLGIKIEKEGQRSPGQRKVNVQQRQRQPDQHTGRSANSPP